LRQASRLAVALAAVVAFAGIGASTSSSATKKKKDSYLSPSLRQAAKERGNERIRVIIQADAGVSGAVNAFNTQGRAKDGDQLRRKLQTIGAVAVEIKAKKLEKLAELTGLTITPDEPLHPASFTNDQLWPSVAGVAQMWSGLEGLLPSITNLPTIAIVDSGIDADRIDVAGRVLANVNLATAEPNSPGDGRGHGTFVASVAAGAAPGFAGAAPTANLVSVDIMNDEGMAWTSDVIAAADWIIANKATYNIRVANFSLHSSFASSFTVDPLDKAVEKLWFSGVTVVAAAGNYGEGTCDWVKYAPANDPFVITVGAADVNNTVDASDDFAAPWSACGSTYDGFMKPEVGAAGRYMVAAVPPLSTLATERPENVVAPGYMRLSGTSFAAPVVAGAAAYVLAMHPEYTPDQVKGALMLTAQPAGSNWSLGVGEVSAVQAAAVTNPPNPNLALNAFLVADPAGGSLPVVDTASWNNTATSDASWNSASWNSASWNSASWNSASWNSASWNSASWNSASWNSASWNSDSWNDAARETAAMFE
jgi:serine protease AprX